MNHFECLIRESNDMTHLDIEYDGLNRHYFSMTRSKITNITKQGNRKVKITTYYSDRRYAKLKKPKFGTIKIQIHEEYKGGGIIHIQINRDESPRINLILWVENIEHKKHPKCIIIRADILSQIGLS